MILNCREKYEGWLHSDAFDKETKAELRSIINDDQEICDRFYKNLDFGTGGLRAIIGAGTNRLNKYTVRRITVGYGAFLTKEYGEIAKSRGVVIAYDMRHKSSEFALEVARTLAALGIRTYIFKSITTTPELSFAVPYKNAVGGIVITASHNPPNYNGYKIYDSTGCQSTPNMANRVIGEINKVVNYGSIAVSAANDKLITWLDESINEAFLDSVKAEMSHAEDICQASGNIKILYTPLHGTGRKPIFRILKELGFKRIFTVEDQLTEDPEFKTVVSPNPEEISAFEMAINVAKENEVDIILGTDPDCDRVGIIVKNGDEYKPLNGNQIGSLLVNYIITTSMNKVRRMNNPYIVKTIVTSELGTIIANFYGVSTYNTLTGFKFIGEKINTIGSDGEFLMGYEESYGYLIGNHARDKDGVGSAVMIAEMAAYYYNRGKNLFQVLEDIYDKFGYFKEKLITKTFEGQTGLVKIKNLMDNYRHFDTEKLGNYDVKKINDYLNGIEGLPKSDVLKFFFHDDSWCAIRPSGTEPKIKYYIGVKGDSEVDAEKKIQRIINFLDIKMG